MSNLEKPKQPQLMTSMDQLIYRTKIALKLNAIKLVEGCDVDSWPDHIAMTSLDTWSTNFKLKKTILLDKNNMKDTKDGWYTIDSKAIPGEALVGIKDINWELFANSSLPGGVICPTFNRVSGGTGNIFEDVMAQAAATSLGSISSKNTIYVDFEAPNRVKFGSAISSTLQPMLNMIPLDVYVKHPINLSTISPTMFHLFRELVYCDIAELILSYMEGFDNVENPLTTSKLNLDGVREWAQKKDAVLEEISRNLISASNKDEPMIICV